MLESAAAFNYIVHLWRLKDPGPDQFLEFTDPESPSPDEHQVLLLNRLWKTDFPGWGLHVWGLTVEKCVIRRESFLLDGQDE